MAKIEVRGNSISLGAIIAILVLVACLVLWILGRHDLNTGLIAALALAYLVG